MNSSGSASSTRATRRQERDKPYKRHGMRRKSQQLDQNDSLMSKLPGFLQSFLKAGMGMIGLDSQEDSGARSAGEQTEDEGEVTLGDFEILPGADHQSMEHDDEEHGNNTASHHQQRQHHVHFATHHQGASGSPSTRENKQELVKIYTENTEIAGLAENAFGSDRVQVRKSLRNGLHRTELREPHQQSLLAQKGTLSPPPKFDMSPFPSFPKYPKLEAGSSKLRATSGTADEVDMMETEQESTLASRGKSETRAGALTAEESETMRRVEYLTETNKPQLTFLEKSRLWPATYYAMPVLERVDVAAVFNAPEKDASEIAAATTAAAAAAAVANLQGTAITNSAMSLDPITKDTVNSNIMPYNKDHRKLRRQQKLQQEILKKREDSQHEQTMDSASEEESLDEEQQVDHRDRKERGRRSSNGQLNGTLSRSRYSNGYDETQRTSHGGLQMRSQVTARQHLKYFSGRFSALDDDEEAEAQQALLAERDRREQEKAERRMIERETEAAERKKSHLDSNGYPKQFVDKKVQEILAWQIAPDIPKAPLASWMCEKCQVRTNVSQQECGACGAEKPALKKPTAEWTAFPPNVPRSHPDLPARRVSFLVPETSQSSSGSSNLTPAPFTSASTPAAASAPSPASAPAPAPVSAAPFAPSFGLNSTTGSATMPKESPLSAAPAMPTTTSAPPPTVSPATPVTNSWANSGLKLPSSVGKWRCDICMSDNADSLSKCGACDSPNPAPKGDASPKKKAEPANTTTTTSVFAMSTPPTVSVAPTIPVVNSWANSGMKLPSSAGKWRCDSCMSDNADTLSKCAACESPKPGKSSSVAPSSIPATPSLFGTSAVNSTSDSSKLFGIGTSSSGASIGSNKPTTSAFGALSSGASGFPPFRPPALPGATSSSSTTASPSLPEFKPPIMFGGVSASGAAFPSSSLTTKPISLFPTPTPTTTSASDPPKSDTFGAKAPGAAAPAFSFGAPSPATTTSTSAPSITTTSTAVAPPTTSSAAPSLFTKPAETSQSASTVPTTTLPAATSASSPFALKPPTFGGSNTAVTSNPLGAPSATAGSDASKPSTFPFGTPTGSGPGLSTSMPPVASPALSAAPFSLGASSKPTLSFGSSSSLTTAASTAPTAAPTAAPIFGGFGGSSTFGSASSTSSSTSLTSTAPISSSVAFGTATSTASTNSPSASFQFSAPIASIPAFGASATNSLPPTTATSTPTKPAFSGFGSGPVAFGAATSAPPSFGATSSAAPTFGGFGAPSAASSTPVFGGASAPPAFGAATPTPAPAFGSSSAPSFGSSTFGTGSTAAFGSQPPTSLTSGGFGAAAQPAFGAAAQPAFGAPAAAQPAFGAPAAAQPAFGAPATAAPAFGAASTAAPAFGGFGSTPTATPSFGFGGNQAPPSQQPPAFGFGSGAPATPTQTPAGFGSFGAQSTPQQSQPAFGGFGQPAAAPSGSSFGFGGQASAPGGAVFPQMQQQPAPQAGSMPGFGFNIGTGDPMDGNNAGTPFGRKIAKMRQPKRR